MESEITNITGGDDLFNRYKMPRLVAKVEGRGNGIKTRLVNCNQVARALHRPPSYVCKFFGCELGAQTKIEEKSDVFIVNGAHEQQVLMEVLQKFIKMFVLCANCNLPETDLVVDKKGNIKQICAACGHSEMVNMTHKLCTYIQNHPPEGKSKSKKEAKKDKKKKDEAEEEDRKTKSRRKKRNEEDGNSKKSTKSDRDSNEDVEQDEERENMDNVPESDVLPPGGLGNVNLDELAESAAKSSKNDSIHEKDKKEEIEWSADTSKEAIRARQAEAAAAARILEGLSISEPKEKNNAENGSLNKNHVEDTEESRVAVLREFDFSRGIPSIAEKALELFPNPQYSLVSRVEKVLLAMLYIETVKEKKIDSIVQRIARVIRTLTAAGGFSHIPVDVQMVLCNHMEHLCEEASNKIPVAIILKVFYDEDVIEEETLLHWYYAKPKGKGAESARTSSSPLIEWLENAESESSS
eukprot:jgi/Galph1/5720/GphlegSOOS_G4302.1